MVMIRVAIWTPDNNPLVDDHILYIVLLAALAFANAGRRWGLGARWQSLSIGRRFPVLA